LDGLDLDIGGLPVDPAVGLMDHDLGVWEDVSFPLGAGGEDDRPAAHRAADAVGRHSAGQELDRVVDRQRVVDAAAGRVDVEVDVLLAVLVGQVEQAHDDRGGRAVMDLTDEEDDAIFEQQLVDRHLAVALHARGHGRHVERVHAAPGIDHRRAEQIVRMSHGYCDPSQA